MKEIPSRGIPSKEAMWLPYYKEVRAFQDENEQLTRNIFPLSEVIKFVFPPKYQVKYYEIAFAFLNQLIEKKGKMESKEIAAFIKQNNISKATFYNRILVRLRRVGMIKVQREIIKDLKQTKKGRKLRISLSKTFGNYLLKIADSWLAIVDDARLR